MKNGTAPPVICRPKGKSVPCVGQFDLREQAVVPSALKSDTPKQVFDVAIGIDARTSKDQRRVWGRVVALVLSGRYSEPLE